ncbi:hypothetical protein GGS20DRAFT_522064 [Poronia punctata]|nr:hypothetical protein GGS20DRAFT_522064 [Poronia punctata]
MERYISQGTRRVYSRLVIPRVPAAGSSFGQQQTQLRHRSSAPTIVHPSFWKSMIPKPLRRKPKSDIDWGTPDSVRPKPPKSKEWNPATFYIVIFLFIGSMSINMIALKRDYSTFMRRAEVRIGVLREVVEKLQRGEEVDVEKSLGTGDAEQEKQWEELIKEIERGDATPRSTRKTTKEGASTAPTPTPTPTPAQTPSTPTTKSNANYSNFF